jgi:signal transduction histidine kinase
VLQGGRQIGTVVAGLSDRPYDRTFNAALVGSLVLAGLLLALVAAMTAAALRAALRPVSRMTTDVADWSEHDLDKRFALGEPYDELTGLARTLDGLLDRIASSLRRERLLTAEISHELRTPLAKISAQAELALRRERSAAEYRSALESVVASAGQMNQTMETLLVAARQQTAGSGGSADLGAVVDRLIGRDLAGGSVQFEVQLPAGSLRVRVDPGILERILAPILENAARYARTRIAVSGEIQGPEVVVTIVDDGRGVPSGDEERIFAPGTVGEPSDVEHPGPGLGLALARRLARDAGGELTATPSANGGRFTLRLPSGLASR